MDRVRQRELREPTKRDCRNPIEGLGIRRHYQIISPLRGPAIVILLVWRSGNIGQTPAGRMQHNSCHWIGSKFHRFLSSLPSPLTVEQNKQKNTRQPAIPIQLHQERSIINKNRQITTFTILTPPKRYCRNRQDKARDIKLKKANVRSSHRECEKKPKKKKGHHPAK